MKPIMTTRSHIYGKRLATRDTPHPYIIIIKKDLRNLIKSLIKPIKYSNLKLEGHLLGESIITLVDNGDKNEFY